MLLCQPPRQRCQRVVLPGPAAGRTLPPPAGAIVALWGRSARAPEAVEDVVEEGPRPVLDLQAGPQPQPDLVPVADVDVGQGRGGVDLVAESDGDADAPQLSAEAGNVGDQVRDRAGWRPDWNLLEPGNGVVEVG